ncbi:hypothetical protein M3689_11170 [Alkalihalophilus marmarensis]|jgi:hypothetical protein|uniref:hypothetical protein n=1 Tax=Alkalihalophilus marmarensis TaxID=521377 RepID=UPI00203EFB67|nr:hypothetical protein [Alkalihalophilus marmarensis]MCM3489869.1 hypothetical protein [Alkalihalophilus marmarensis]
MLTYTEKNIFKEEMRKLTSDYVRMTNTHLKQLVKLEVIQLSLRDTKYINKE